MRPSTIAIDGFGVAELTGAIADHRNYLQKSGGWTDRERARATAELDRLLRDQLVIHVLARIGSNAIDNAVEQIVARKVDAHSAAVSLLVDAGLE